MMKVEHVKFANAILEGKKREEAYAEAYNRDISTEKQKISCRNSACKLLGRKDVKDYMMKINMEILENSNVILNIRERKKILSDIAKRGEKDGDRIKAIDTLNKMDRVYDIVIDNDYELIIDDSDLFEDD